MVWFQVIKGYPPHQLNVTLATFFRDLKDLRQDTIQANDGRANLLHSSGRKAIIYGKIDRRIFDITLEERLQSRTSDLVTWTKTMPPVIRHISEAREQIRTGHQDIRTYFSNTAAPERTRNATLITATAATTTTHRPSPNRHSPAISADKNPASSDFNRHSPVQTSRHPYLFLRHDSGRTNHERDASHHGKIDHFHSQHLLSSARLSQPISASTNPGDASSREFQPPEQSVPSLVYVPS
jgi:hypothetical protein